LPVHCRVWGWAAVTLYAAAAAAGYLIIARRSGKMSMAVSAYIILITLMGMATVLPLGSARTTGVVLAMAGAFLFMGSDTINAYNRLVREIPFEWLLTMGAYLAAQFLLVQGYLML
ncbi:MAG: hypothetical protein EG826_17115, partial [Deltaproteobacteria bacterium]|nr:hypothetical protein [Deltaproteobacteria bacterium]